jgi:hypothetical protein
VIGLADARDIADIRLGQGQPAEDVFSKEVGWQGFAREFRH